MLVLLYIFWFLHQTTTLYITYLKWCPLYIFWFLHQTTTMLTSLLIFPSCISFDSYTKPQPIFNFIFLHIVIYLLIPTPNHNDVVDRGKWSLVVYLLIPTPNHNHCDNIIILLLLYIFWFLHQTTTRWQLHLCCWCCISFDSYTKPQQLSSSLILYLVVYLLIPTPNHNCVPPIYKILLLYIFWFLHQTTTEPLTTLNVNVLYIFWFLHQTTTDRGMNRKGERCISFDSYIKPQLHNRSHLPITCCISFDSYIKPQHQNNLLRKDYVVYLLIPTSNHNQCQTL